jgi:RecB family exonuclease
MDLPDLPAPTSGPIVSVSPSEANDLIACPLRVAFARDARFAHWRRPSTASSLGEAAHRLTETAFRHRDAPDATPARIWLEGQWVEAITRSAKRLAEAWKPAQPPPPEQWPGYQLTRMRTIRRAERLINQRRDTPSQQRRADTGIEVTLSDAVTGLHGRADRIDEVEGRLRVVDLKTGINQSDPSAAQTRQLHLYAFLARQTTGRWPDDVTIENASGEQITTPLRPAEAESSVDEVLTAVRDFNRWQADGGELAVVSANDVRCRWCDFRVVCEPYWQHLRHDWDHRSVLGIVTAAGQSDNGGHVDMAVASPMDLPNTSIRITNLPGGSPPAGSWLAVTDLSSGETTSMARWTSRIAAWSAPSDST